MGEICRASCECNYSKKLYVGGGLSSCNLNIINRIFSTEKLREFNDYYKSGEVQSFYFDNELALCKDCKEIETVEVLKIELKTGNQLIITNDCHTCGAKVELLKEVLCPRCGRKMNLEEVGNWD